MVSRARGDMTVIAANLKEMAADTLVTLEGHPHYHTSKIFRLEDGSIIGGAGGGLGLDEMLAWLKAGSIHGNEPDLKGADDFFILRLAHDGLWLYADSVYPDRLKEKAFAVGCGCDIALHTMRYGKRKSPADAVREVCKINPGCGLPVEVLRLGRKR